MLKNKTDVHVQIWRSTLSRHLAPLKVDIDMTTVHTYREIFLWSSRCQIKELELPVLIGGRLRVVVADDEVRRKTRSAASCCRDH